MFHFTTRDILSLIMIIQVYPEQLNIQEHNLIKKTILFINRCKL